MFSFQIIQVAKYGAEPASLAKPPDTDANTSFIK